MDHTVRLAAFSELTHQTKEVVRNRQKLEQTPWDETAFKGEGQRRYNGLNALQIIIQEMLINQGITPALAGECCRDQSAVIEAFLSAARVGKADQSTVVAALVVLEWDSFTQQVTKTPATSCGSGSSAEWAQSVASHIGRIGIDRETRRGRSTERTVAVQFNAVSVGEAYNQLLSRAELAGYAIHGLRILPLNGQTEGDGNVEGDA